MLQATAADPRVARLIVPTGGHNFRTYRTHLPAVLAWLGGTRS